eukprot:m51a1_g2023 hypothetical protein (720) ;mRNA; r:1292167-1294468
MDPRSAWSAAAAAAASSSQPPSLGDSQDYEFFMDDSDNLGDLDPFEQLCVIFEERHDPRVVAASHAAMGEDFDLTYEYLLNEPPSLGLPPGDDSSVTAPAAARALAWAARRLRAELAQGPSAAGYDEASAAAAIECFGSYAAARDALRGQQAGHWPSAPAAATAGGARPGSAQGQGQGQQRSPLQKLVAEFGDEVAQAEITETLRGASFNYDAARRVLLGRVTLPQPALTSQQTRKQQQQRQQQQPHEVSEEEEAIAALVAEFGGEYDLDSIVGVWEQFGGDYYAARDALGGQDYYYEQQPQQQQQQQYAAPAQQQQQQQRRDPSDPRSQIPCTFFMAGRCSVSNCPYLHSVPVCRFWAAGNCYKGAACPFAHPPRTPQQPQQQQQQPQQRAAPAEKIPDSSEFPPLTEAPAGQQQQQQEGQGQQGQQGQQQQQQQQQGQQRLTQAQVVVLGEIQRRFSWVPRDVVEGVFVKCMHVRQKAEEFLAETFGAPEEPEEQQQQQQQQPKTASAVPSSSLAPPQGKPRRNVTPVPWVESGSQLGKLYEKERREAQTLMEMRNMTFSRATASYLSGDKAAAHKLSQRAREIDSQIWDLHRLARERILAERNKRLQPGQLDLHGLHVDEAVDILEEIAQQPRQSPVPMVVVTGIGRHNEAASGGSGGNGEGKLASGVRHWLERSGMEHHDCSPDGRGGSWRVSLPASPSNATPSPTASPPGAPRQ